MAKSPSEVRIFYKLIENALYRYVTDQSRSQSPRPSVGGIVRLWENGEENQRLIGCLIINLTHFLLIEIRAILIIQELNTNLFIT